ncbi:MAG TPA: DUF2397 family protein [Ktedonobacteraceae bacterium]
MTTWEADNIPHPSAEGSSSQEHHAPIAQTAQAHTFSPPTTFRRFGPLPIVNYVASTTERTDWYRAVMRTFFQHSHQYHYRLTAQEVMEAVRADLNREYHLDACKRDLESLVTWGNLTALPDMSRVTTIADFRSPVLLYQATPDALEFEAFIETHMHVGASEGGLHQGDLLHLLETLQQIDRWLQEGKSAHTPERCQQIANAWQQAFSTWERVTNDAAQYLGSMNQGAQHSTDLNAYLLYKNVVTTYIHDFADALAQYSQTLCKLFLNWSTTGKSELLLTLILSTTPPSPTLADNRALWSEDIQRQVQALSEWFLQEHNAAMFSRAAHDAIEKVVSRAYALAASMRPQTDYVSMLHTLASSLLRVEDLETAAFLFASAFACTTPIHLAEGVAGSPTIAEAPDAGKVWQQSATVTRELRPIYKGNVERVVEKPLRDNVDAFYRIKQAHDVQLARQKEHLQRLFPAPLLDLGMLSNISSEERTLLTAIIDGCFCSPVFETTLADGSLVTLLNPEEQRYVALCAHDGTLLLPRYQFQRRLTVHQR